MVRINKLFLYASKNGDECFDIKAFVDVSVHEYFNLRVEVELAALQLLAGSQSMKQAVCEGESRREAKDI